MKARLPLGSISEPPEEVRVVAHVGIHHQRRRHVLLVEDPFLPAAIRLRVRSLAGVPVIEDQQGVVVDVAHVVLVGEPRVGACWRSP